MKVNNIAYLYHRIILYRLPMKEMWNQRFQGETYIYGQTPNQQFKTFIEKLTPGQLLLPGEGEGRNAVFAASLGWQVTAVDFSEEGRKKALLLAEQNHLKLDYVLSPVEEYQPASNRYDAIACIFLHMPPSLRHRTYQQLMKALTPGGQLLVVGFSKEQLRYNSGGPKNEDWLFAAQELEEEFNGLEVITNREQLITLDEGPFHTGQAAVVEFLAVKPQ